MHPNAIVSEHASISPETEIGPYTAVEFHVRIDGEYNDVVIDSNNYTQCGTTLDCAPQNYNYKTGHTKLIAGDYK